MKRPNATTLAIRWLDLTFPGSTIIDVVESSITRTKGTNMSDQNLFDLPDEAKEDAQLSDFAGSLVLIRPTSTKKVETSFGATDVTVADVVAISSAGKLVSMPNTFIFWKGVQDQLASKLGTHRWVAGVLRQGAGKNSKAWSLGVPTDGERQRLTDVMASKEFLGLMEDLNEEPF